MDELNKELNKELWDNYNKAMSNLRAASNTKTRTRGHENAVGEAYRKLVNAGLATPLRGKYVHVKHGR